MARWPRLLAPLASAFVISAPGHAHQVVTTGDVQVVTAPESEMVYVSGGKFEMGPSEDERMNLGEACIDEMGTHDEAGAFCTQSPPFTMHFTVFDAESRRVHVSAFEIDRHEVTTARYRECVADGTCSLLPLVSGDVRFIQDDWPIVNVTWQEAQTYCQWRGKRLPTEAEWEKAARGTDGRRWPWGTVDDDDRANRGKFEEEFLRPPVQPGYLVLPEVTDDSDGTEGLAPPGTYFWGKSPYGVQDMAGNVAEWVADWYAPGYRSTSAIDPQGPGTGSFRVARGGSFLRPRMFARTYFRNRHAASQRSSDLGFRCVRGETQKDPDGRGSDALRVTRD